MTFSKIPSYLNKISSLTIIILIAQFYLACYHFSYNFFFEDDFHLLRYVTLTQDNTLAFSEKLKALWNLHNEHRIVFPRLLVLLDYYVQGHIDWKVLNTAAALYYLGIFVFLSIIVKKIALPLWYTLPIALFVFQPASHENFYWTISILQQLGNIFWGMFLFYSLIYFPPKSFWVSILLALILTFTHGNGLFALGVGAIILTVQKKYKELVILLIFILFISFAYFWGYYTAQNSNIEGSLSNPVQLFGCFGGFWGNFIRDIFKSQYKTLFSILGGLFVFLLLSLINIKFLFTLFNRQLNDKFSKEKLFVLALFLFFSITAILVALSRSWSSIESGFQNRYLHNSIITFLLLYLSILLLKSSKVSLMTGIIFLILGLTYNITAWYNNYELILFHRDNQEADATNYQLNGITINNDKSFNHNISEILKQSFRDGISVFQKSEITEHIKNIDAYTSKTVVDLPVIIQKDSALEFNIDNSNFRRVYHIQNFTLPTKNDVYLVLRSDKNIFVWATSHRRNSKKNFLLTGQFFTDGFFTTVMTDAMPENQYTIGILQKNNKGFIYYPTNYKIQNR